jgi:MFS family permease
MTGMPPGAVRLLVGGAVINISLGSLFSWSLFVEPLAEEFGSSAAALAGVFSVSVMIFAAVVLAGGPMVDRRRPRSVVVVAAGAAVAGLLLASRAPSLPWILAGYGVLFGVGNGLGYASAVAVAGKGFGDRRGLALGVVVGAYAAGPLVASPTITALLAAGGWRSTFAVLGAVIGLALLLGAVLLGDGLHRDGTPTRAPGDARPLLLPPGGVALWAAFLLGTLPALLVVAHAATIAASGGLRPAAVSAAVALLGAGNLTGRAGGGWLSDRIGRLPGLRIATLTLSGACLALAAVSATAPVLVLMVVVGVGYGTQSALVPALTADMFGVEHFGANYGRIFTGWGVAGLLGPQIGAALGDPGRGFAVPLVIGATSAACAFGLHVLLGRWSPTA